MPDKRVDALNSLNKNDYNSKYVTLSDNTKIGVDLITDLIKYFELEFKNKYRYDYLKWTKINVPSNEIYRYNPQPLPDCGPAPAVHPPTGAASPPAPASANPTVSAPGAEAGAATTAEAEAGAGAGAGVVISEKYKIIFGDDEKKDENDKKAIEKLKKLLKNNTEKKYDILIDLSEAAALATALATAVAA